MTTIYLVRHGQTLWNTEGRMQGFKDSPLTELGVTQANALSIKLKHIDFNKIYSSSLSRAYNTASILRGNRSMKIIKNDNLREIYMGIWEGHTQEEIEKLEGKELYNFWNAPHKYNPKTGEDFYHLTKRAVKEVEKIAKEKDGNILIVSHAAFIKSFTTYISNLHIKHLWEAPFIPQTSLTIVEYEAGNWKIIKYGDISHYENEMENIIKNTV